MYHARCKGRLDFRNLQTILVEIERLIILNNTTCVLFYQQQKKTTTSFVVWFESFLLSKLHMIKHTPRWEMPPKEEGLSSSLYIPHSSILPVLWQTKKSSSWMKITNLSSIKTQLNSVIAFKRIIVNQLDHTHATSVGVNSNNYTKKHPHTHRQTDILCSNWKGSNRL